MDIAGDQWRKDASLSTLLEKRGCLGAIGAGFPETVMLSGCDCVDPILLLLDEISN